jgi:hypothetical protein
MTITAFMRPRRIKPEVDFFNINHMKYPKTIGSSELVDYDFPTQFNIAIEKGVKVLENFYQHITNGTPLDSSLYDRDYTGELATVGANSPVTSDK